MSSAVKLGHSGASWTTLAVAFQVSCPKSAKRAFHFEVFCLAVSRATRAIAADTASCARPR
eukprot:11723969-Alexandrium_andersonii.AAC.1